jgi:hypothetical protein
MNCILWSEFYFILFYFLFAWNTYLEDVMEEVVKEIYESQFGIYVRKKLELWEIFTDYSGFFLLSFNKHSMLTFNSLINDIIKS